jgi:cellulose synthase operon protein C
MKRLTTALLVLSLAGGASAEPAPPARKAAKERSIAASAGGDVGDIAVPQDLAAHIFHGRATETTQRQALSADRVERMIEARQGWIEQRRAEGIRELERFVASEPESVAEMADALLRLAELRWEQARAEQLRAFEAWQKAPKQARAADAPRIEIDAALGLYDRILTRHADFDRLDLVLYMKAYALLEASRMTDALQSYKRILDEFPTSKFRPDAHMAFAEWHFGGSYDYASALREYDHVLQYPQSELSDLALFKSAWCLWKLGRVTEAATRFRQVLDLDGQLGAVSEERRRRLLELQDEALEYLIQVFTEDERNTAADVHRFLSGIGGEQYAGRVLRRLSRAFFDQARYPRAIEAYQMLLAREPDDANAPTYQRQIAEAHAALEDAPSTIAALTALAANYGPTSAWAQKQADPEIVARAERSAERAIRAQALRYHERAQREKQTQQFEYAEKLYRVHVQHFTKSPFRYQVTFYLAEILYHRLNKPEEAGDFYLLAARENPKGELTKDALYNAILAFESVRQKELQGCKPGMATTGTACSETPTDRKFSDATALYVQLFPQDPEVPGILFRQGRMYFDRGVYDPAVRLFGQLLQSYPHSPYAATAGELVLESFNRAADYANIERWARSLKKAPAFQNAESQRKLDALILQSVFKLGEQLAEKGEHRRAAEAYLRAAQEFPRDERAPKAYYNAGQQWQRAGNVEAADDTYSALIEQHPGSEEGALGAWAAAQMFEAIAQFREAAHYYERYAKSFPKADKRQDALYNAVLLRLAASDDDDAIADGKLFVQTFPSSPLADEVYFSIGRAHEKKQRWAEAADTYRRYQKTGRNADRKVEAHTRLGQVLAAQGDLAGADKAWAAAVKAGKKGDVREGLYFAAQARFLQGDQVLVDFEKIKIAGDIKGLRKRLEQKSELLRKAAQVYGDVVEFRVSEWLTAALYKIGRSYELFADSLRDAPVPEGLSEAEDQAYRDELAKFIVPIEERALEAYEGGYRKALELRVFNTWTQKQREALTRLNDIEYPPLREAGADLAEARVLPLPVALDGLRRQPGAGAVQVAQAPTGKPGAASTPKKNRGGKR